MFRLRSENISRNYEGISILRLIITLLLPVFFFNSLAAATNPPKDEVAIIGAGLAGLRASFELKKAGIPHTVYEAGGRLGGRVQSTDWPNLGAHFISELGGSFVNSDHRDLIELVKSLGLNLATLEPQNKYKMFCDITPCQGAKDLYAAYHKLGMRVLDEQKKLGDIEFRIDKPSLRFLELEKLSVYQYLKSLNSPQRFIQITRSLYQSTYGVDLEDQSALTFVDDFVMNPTRHFIDIDSNLGDEMFRIKEGTNQLVGRLSQQCGPIKLGHRVDQVSQKDQMIHLKITASGGKVNIAKFKYVIVTVPLPILQSDLKIDHPRSSELNHLTQSFTVGQNTKHFFFFNKAFWRDQGVCFPHIIGELGIVRGSDYHEGGSLHSLVFFTGGKASQLVSSWSSLERQKHVLDLISRAFPDVHRHFVSSAEGMRWIHHPLIKGSYTGGPRPGRWRQGKLWTSKRLDQIHFAGTFWSDDSQGYMNGAVASGKSAAQRIIREIKS